MTLKLKGKLNSYGVIDEKWMIVNKSEYRTLGLTNGTLKKDVIMVN